MSYWETLLVILRRWRISVPAILLAVGVGIGAFFAAPAKYEDTSQVLFLGSPTVPGDKTLVNPYLDLGSALVSTADVIRLKVSTTQVADELSARGAKALYTVALDQSTPAPVLIVSVEAGDKDDARATTTAVVEEIQTILKDLQRQAGAPADTWVKTSVISSLPEPQRKLNASIRPAIVAAGGIFAVTMFVLFLLEGGQRRRKPKPARPAESSGPPPSALLDPAAARSTPPMYAPEPNGYPVYQQTYPPQPVAYEQPQAPQPVYAPPPVHTPQPVRAPHPVAPAPQPVAQAPQYRAQQSAPRPNGQSNGHPMPQPQGTPAAAYPQAGDHASAGWPQLSPATREVPLLRPARPIRHENSTSEGQNGHDAEGTDGSGTPNGAASHNSTWPR